MAIIPDEIQAIDGYDIPRQVKTIYDYIKYMCEQIDFWASRRTQDISGVQDAIAGRTIIDSGDGYMALGDGTLLQWGTATDSVVINHQWGGVYYAQLANVQFPIAFADVPVVTLQRTAGVSILTIDGTASNTGIGSIYVYRPISDETERTLTYSWIAIGRWQ